MLAFHDYLHYHICASQVEEMTKISPVLSLMLLNLKALPCLFQAVHSTGILIVCMILGHVDSHTDVGEDRMSGEGKTDRSSIICALRNIAGMFLVSSENHQSL